MLKCKALLQTPTGGVLIEWLFVAAVNLNLILFCSFYGLYAKGKEIYSTDLLAIIPGPIMSLIIYCFAYVALVIGPDCCSEQPQLGIPQWALRSINMFYQVLHAILFSLFLHWNTEATVVLAYWLYGLIPFGFGLGYWSTLLLSHIRKKVEEEYTAAYKEMVAEESVSLAV